jgi:tRNA dimethylallyltransferase
MNRLIAIGGPTGIGKSQLALRLAQTFGGEIVNADSRQVYRHMDIGTAKPAPRELSLVPHHLIDIVDPDEDFGLARYQELAYRAIGDIQQRDRLPLLVGGSGLYVWAVLEGWGIPKVPPDPEFRHRLEEKAAGLGREEVYQELVRVAPTAAQNIDPRNVRRVIRALEVYRSQGADFVHHKKAPPFGKLIIGLTTDREELYRRIDLRVDEMIKQGLVAEVEKLVNMGYGLDLPAMSGIGYRQIGLFLKGELTLPAAIQQIKHETHRFVRHQYAWFRLKDERIKWFDIQRQPESEIRSMLAEFITGE